MIDSGEASGGRPAAPGTWACGARPVDEPADWTAFVRARRPGCVERQRRGLDGHRSGDWVIRLFPTPQRSCSRWSARTMEPNAEQGEDTG
ncbi:hypothetical protein EKG83_09235 [Saccharothrix syringae]|uniref:Uncharacterized protein n=1 Tax=Saccharothrix syringae TaxID=103733 RepID=A0A5Q0GW10_SACSY|nr:hypothetical protein EKG83_09235 [Saccharothrix syringae]